MIGQNKLNALTRKLKRVPGSRNVFKTPIATRRLRFNKDTKIVNGSTNTIPRYIPETEENAYARNSRKSMPRGVTRYRNVSIPPYLARLFAEIEHKYDSYPEMVDFVLSSELLDHDKERLIDKLAFRYANNA